MPGWCEFYKQPPREFWELTSDEYERMAEYAREYTKRMSASGR